MNKYIDSIKIDIDNFTKLYIGWEAKHKFRCKTRGDNSSIADYIFVFCKDIKTILLYEDVDDEDEIQIRKLLDQIKATI